MSVTIELKEPELAKAKDLRDFYARLSQEHPDRWIALFDTGELLAEKKLDKLYAKAQKKESRIVVLLYSSKTGELLLR